MNITYEYLVYKNRVGEKIFLEKIENLFGKPRYISQNGSIIYFYSSEEIGNLEINSLSREFKIKYTPIKDNLIKKLFIPSESKSKNLTFFSNKVYKK